METIVGAFSHLRDAEDAVKQLRTLGFTHDRIYVLTPGVSEKELMAAVPTTQTEQPGMGKALGGVVGGGTGLLWGGLTAPVVTSLLVPGIGPVLAIGLAYATLSGLIGASVGVAAGEAVEESLDTGLPQDELFVYEDALRRGRTVVIALADNSEQEEAARNVMMQAGAESLDAAREQWWVGLRDAEESAYEAPDGEFARVEATYRTGFEAALRSQARGRSYEEMGEYLRETYPTIYLEEPFRRGYERGQVYYRGRAERDKQARNRPEGSERRIDSAA
jgi:hypothetical protein